MELNEAKGDVVEPGVPAADAPATGAAALARIVPALLETLVLVGGLWWLLQAPHTTGLYLRVAAVAAAAALGGVACAALAARTRR